MPAPHRVDEFLAYLANDKGFSGNTLSAYRNDLTQFADYLDSGQMLSGRTVRSWSEVSREDIMSFVLFRVAPTRTAGAGAATGRRAAR